MNETQHELGGHRSILERIARQAMVERGLEADFSPEALSEVRQLPDVSFHLKNAIDLRPLPWLSIDNDDTHDIDQLTAAQVLTGNTYKIRVAIPHVASVIKKNGPLDMHAQVNTSSIYIPGKVFPMLPHELSQHKSSFKLNADRLAMVIEMDIDSMGKLIAFNVEEAIVRNHAKLSYATVTAFLAGKDAAKEKLEKNPEIADNLKIQNNLALRLRSRRFEQGAMDIETTAPRPLFRDELLEDVIDERRTSSKKLIEDIMIAANGATARYLEQKGLPCLRRVVRTPKRWERIVDLAIQHGGNLPQHPDSIALSAFLNHEKEKNPGVFPELSLAIIKLLGKGEYVVDVPGGVRLGHFGLAVGDYTHSTAPLRRFCDLVTQRLLQSALDQSPMPYNLEELSGLAAKCTQKEDDVMKVERRVAKSAAALLLAFKIGETFSAICTGASMKGTWVKIFHPYAEGRLIEGYEGVDVGQKIQVVLVNADVESGYIDFKRVGL